MGLKGFEHSHVDHSVNADYNTSYNAPLRTMTGINGKTRNNGRGQRHKGMDIYGHMPSSILTHGKAYVMKYILVHGTSRITASHNEPYFVYRTDRHQTNQSGKLNRCSSTSTSSRHGESNLCQLSSMRIPTFFLFHRPPYPKKRYITGDLHRRTNSLSYHASQT